MKTKCSTCIYKFECLAKHYIPENYGNDCKKYKEHKMKIFITKTHIILLDKNNQQIDYIKKENWGGSKAEAEWSKYPVIYKEN